MAVAMVCRGEGRTKNTTALIKAFRHTMSGGLIVQTVQTGSRPDERDFQDFMRTSSSLVERYISVVKFSCRFGQ